MGAQRRTRNNEWRATNVDRQSDRLISGGVNIYLGEIDAMLITMAGIANFKLPRRVTFHTELPREDTGNIFKRKLREPYSAQRERRV